MQQNISADDPQRRPEAAVSEALLRFPPSKKKSAFMFFKSKLLEFSKKSLNSASLIRPDWFQLDLKLAGL